MATTSGTTEGRVYKNDRDREDARRAYEAGKKAKQRRNARDLLIPECANPHRRKQALGDVVEFARTYFGHKVYNELTEDHVYILRIIVRQAIYGGDKAIAAPRGEGKTTLAEIAIIFLVLRGLIRFPVICAANSTLASLILQNIKDEFETNELLTLDFPEVCLPIQDLQGAPQRANMQTVNGVHSDMQWSKGACVFPTVKGSKCSGAVIMCFGLDSAIRGVRFRNMRPDFVLVDDPETHDSAKSEYQTADRQGRIDRDLMGLAGQGRRIGRLVLATIQAIGCLSDNITNVKIKPTWNGTRIPFLKRLPTNADKWTEFIEIIHEGFRVEPPDLDMAKARAFYAENREIMDEGAIVSNPNRHDAEKQLSSLQWAYETIARIGWEAFNTEYQNEPPEILQEVDNGITASAVRSRLNGRDRGLVHDDAMALTCFIDVGKHSLHWVSIAWLPGCVGHVVDYGVETVHNANKVGDEKAILSALRSLRDSTESVPLTTDSGEVRKFDCVLIDAGNWDQVIYGFVKEVGAPYRASKGFSRGVRTSPFKDLAQHSRNRKVGNHWILSAQRAKGVWLVDLDADHWKSFAHSRWLTHTFNEDGDTYRPGSLSLFGRNDNDHVRRASERTHTAFSHHMVSEVLKEEFIPGKGIKKYWDKQRGANHWFDCVAGCCAAADMCGVRIGSETVPPPATESRVALATAAATGESLDSTPTNPRRREHDPWDHRQGW